MSGWTDELKSEVIEEYTSANPTAENSTEIVSKIADRIGKTPNGVRMILSKAGVYVKKEPEKPSGKPSGGGTRVSKEAAQNSLAELIKARGKEVDDSIVSKLTGKACVYLVEVFSDD